MVEHIICQPSGNETLPWQLQDFKSCYKTWIPSLISPQNVDSQSFLSFHLPFIHSIPLIWKTFFPQFFVTNSTTCRDYLYRFFFHTLEVLTYREWEIEVIQLCLVEHISQGVISANVILSSWLEYTKEWNEKQMLKNEKQILAFIQSIVVPKCSEVPMTTKCQLVEWCVKWNKVISTQLLSQELLHHQIPLEMSIVNEKWSELVSNDRQLSTRIEVYHKLVHVAVPISITCLLTSYSFTISSNANHLTCISCLLQRIPLEYLIQYFDLSVICDALCHICHVLHIQTSNQMSLLTDVAKWYSLHSFDVNLSWVIWMEQIQAVIRLPQFSFDNHFIPLFTKLLVNDNPFVSLLSWTVLQSFSSFKGNQKWYFSKLLIKMLSNHKNAWTSVILNRIKYILHHQQPNVIQVSSTTLEEGKLTEWWNTEGKKNLKNSVMEWRMIQLFSHLFPVVLIKELFTQLFQPSIVSTSTTNVEQMTSIPEELIVHVSPMVRFKVVEEMEHAVTKKLTNQSTLSNELTNYLQKLLEYYLQWISSISSEHCLFKSKLFQILEGKVSIANSLEKHWYLQGFFHGKIGNIFSFQLSQTQFLSKLLQHMYSASNDLFSMLLMEKVLVKCCVSNQNRDCLTSLQSWIKSSNPILSCLTVQALHFAIEKQSTSPSVELEQQFNYPISIPSNLSVPLLAISNYNSTTWYHSLSSKEERQLFLSHVILDSIAWEVITRDISAVQQWIYKDWSYLEFSNSIFILSVCLQKENMTNHFSFPTLINRLEQCIWEWHWLPLDLFCFSLTRNTNSVLSNQLLYYFLCTSDTVKQHLDSPANSLFLSIPSLAYPKLIHQLLPIIYISIYKWISTNHLTQVEQILTQFAPHLLQNEELLIYFSKDLFSKSIVPYSIKSFWIRLLRWNAPSADNSISIIRQLISDLGSHLPNIEYSNQLLESIVLQSQDATPIKLHVTKTSLQILSLNFESFEQLSQCICTAVFESNIVNPSFCSLTLFYQSAATLLSQLPVICSQAVLKHLTTDISSETLIFLHSLFTRNVHLVSQWISMILQNKEVKLQQFFCILQSVGPFLNHFSDSLMDQLIYTSILLLLRNQEIDYTYLQLHCDVLYSTKIVTQMSEETKRKVQALIHSCQNPKMKAILNANFMQ